MPWVESPDDVDEEFIQFIKDYNFVSKQTVMELSSKYADKDIFVFKSREEADTYLKHRR